MESVTDPLMWERWSSKTNVALFRKNRNMGEAAKLSIQPPLILNGNSPRGALVESQAPSLVEWSESNTVESYYFCYYAYSETTC